jgi:hypothetical protein
MDAQTIPNGNGYGETLRIWNFDTYARCAREGPRDPILLLRQ